MALKVWAFPMLSSETIFVVIDLIATAPTPAIIPIIVPESNGQNTIFSGTPLNNSNNYQCRHHRDFYKQSLRYLQ